MLFRSVMALAARTSDHPLLVGTDSPAVSQLASYAMEGSLAEYGRRRETACRELTDRAVSLTDQAGTMRIPSVENVATLLLLEGLVECELPIARARGAGADRILLSRHCRRGRRLRHFDQLCSTHSSPLCGCVQCSCKGVPNSSQEVFSWLTRVVDRQSWRRTCRGE